MGCSTSGLVTEITVGKGLRPRLSVPSRWEAVSWRSQIHMYSWRRVLHSDCFWILAALRALYTGLPMTEGQVPISAHLVGATIDVFSTGVWGKEFVWWFHTCMFYLTQWHLLSVLLALVREGCVSSSL